MEFYEVAQAVFKTPNGERLLKILEEDYLDPTAIGPDSHTTYYRLGQKELVQSLRQAVELDTETLNQLLNQP